MEKRRSIKEGGGNEREGGKGRNGELGKQIERITSGKVVV
jgi:hypothetical protein